jgi:Tol biopolymer transport system component
LISSVAANSLPRFSPDGTKIAFESERSGYDEIWVCNSDGSNPTAITSLRGYSGSPRWAPDSRFLAFDYRGKGYSQIFVADVTAGTARSLSIFPDADNVVPSWSQDGKSIYFASKRMGESFQIWKAPVTGGVPVQVTKQGGYAPVESGGFLYYSRGLEQAAIWRLPLAGNEETLVLETPGLSSYNQWEVTWKGIYFIDSKTHQKATIVFFNFTTKNIMPIWTMEKSPWAGIAVSPDGKTLVYPQNDQDEYNITVLKSLF